ncbi:MAG: EamA family transporter [Elusimicrobia bacterium]|nr:EamA family transporter [Elusimicrobiota bacterium]
MNWKIFAIGSAVFAGLTAVLAKIGVRDIPSNLATLIRTIIITVFLGLLVIVRNEWSNPAHLDRKCLLFLVMSAITTGISWLCYYRALQNGPASLVAPIDKLSVVFAAVFAALFLGERLNMSSFLGVSLITIGAVIIVLK